MNARTNAPRQDDSLPGWDRFKGLVQAIAESAPFDERTPRTVWRGGTQGKSCWSGVNGTNVRVQPGEEEVHTAALTCGRRALRRRMLEPEATHYFDIGYDFLDLSQQVRRVWVPLIISKLNPTS